MTEQELVNKFEEADRKLDGNDMDKLLYWLEEAGIHIKNAWDGLIMEQVEHERLYGKDELKGERNDSIGDNTGLCPDGVDNGSDSRDMELGR